MKTEDNSGNPQKVYLNKIDMCNKYASRIRLLANAGLVVLSDEQRTWINERVEAAKVAKDTDDFKDAVIPLREFFHIFVYLVRTNTKVSYAKLGELYSMTPPGVHSLFLEGKRIHDGYTQRGEPIPDIYKYTAPEPGWF